MKLQNVYVEDCMCRALVYEWYKSFKDGHEIVQSEERSETFSISKSEKQY